MSELSDKTIFTVCNVAYLSKVMVLAESLYEHNNCKLEVFVFDKEREVECDSRYCTLHWVERLDIPNFSSLSFKYTVVELTTALKPCIALSLLTKYSKIIFLDPDVMAFNSLEPIFNLLEKHPIILTPHYYCPKINGLIDDEQIMRFGAYNLGFFAVNSTDDSESFLNWWSERCLANAFDDTQFGIFTDQKWVSIAPMFFPFIHVSYNPGLNVAFWNLDERVITCSFDGKYLVNDNSELLFLHFSAFDNNSPETLSKRIFNIGENEPDKIAELGVLYSERLKKYAAIADDMSYSFDYMSDGKYITPSLRRAYAAMLDYFDTDDNPFDSHSLVAIFASKNKLFQKSDTPYIAEGYTSVGSHKIKFKIAYFLMRCILRILGPNKFMNFSRLLVFLSRYHVNRDIWKT